jgi:3-(3-hydroxy-phenyl)propionate hydroxylase
VTVLSLAEVDPDGSVAAAMDATPNEVWIIRADAHIAAAATSVAEAADAAYRVLGMPSPVAV